MFTPSSLLVLTYLTSLIGARADAAPPATASLNTTWIAAASAAHYIPILTRLQYNFTVVCGFYRQNDSKVYHFSVFFLPLSNDDADPWIVWSANRNRPVRTQATLELTEEGDLILKDADGSFVWSSKTSGKSASGINLTDTGNLVLFDKKNAIVWQSSDHLTDDPPPTKNSKDVDDSPEVIVPASLGSLLAFIFVMVIIKCRARNKATDEAEEDKDVNKVAEVSLDQIPGAPKRFTYEDLKAITENFNKRLGEGGFSSVYQGTLTDGTKVAVKQLNGFCQTKKSFLAEVESIGNIHHVNLVRLVGFCAENFHRLLVYEYMSKGSLDKWIFHKLDDSFLLDWQQRRKIIFDIANGLHYLHEECRWKIVHMDIKPQNILLDVNLNAKVGDFGLSKLIDRDQSQIVTTMRGTPGYLAPEWLHAAVTEKVDVYSFGVVILEIVCGRNIFEKSNNEDGIYLLGVFKTKSEEGRLLDMIDKQSEDMQLNGPDVVNMMRLAAWCLQVDFRKRPSMSIVIKVLEGVMEVPNDLDYNFAYATLMNVSVRIGQEDVEIGVISSVEPSVLSGPR